MFCSIFDTLLVISWLLYLILLPGYLFSKLINDHQCFLKRFYSSLLLGIYINIIICYILDIFTKVTFSTLLFLNTIVVIFQLLLLFRKNSHKFLFGLEESFTVKNIIFNIFSKKGIYLLVFLILFILAVFPFTAFLFFDNGIYPSDPIFTHLKVRYILITGSFVNELNEASKGYAMSYPLGLEYLLSSLSMLNFVHSYWIVRVTGPLLSILTVVCLYELVSEIFKGKNAALPVFLLVGAARGWIWYRKMTLANGVAELFSIYSLICLNSFIEENNIKCLTEFFIITAASWLIHPPMTIMYPIFAYILAILFYNKQKLTRKFTLLIKFLIIFLLLTFPYWISINMNTILWRVGLASEAKDKLRFSGPYQINFSSMVLNFLTAWSGWNLPAIYGVVPVFSGIVSLFLSLEIRKYKILFLISLLTIVQFIYYFIFIEPFSAILEWTYSKQRMVLHTQLNFILLIPILFLYSKKLRLKIKFLNKSLSSNKLLLTILYLLFGIQLLINYYGLYSAGELFYTYRGYNIDQDFISLLDYLDKKLPLNITIMIDDMNTYSFESLINKVKAEKPWIKSYTAIVWEATYQHFILTEYNEYYSPDRSRSFTWLAISRLYPRIVEGNESFVASMLHLNCSKEYLIRYFNMENVNVLIIHNQNFINVAHKLAEMNQLPYISWKNKYVVIFLDKNLLTKLFQAHSVT